MAWLHLVNPLDVSDTTSIHMYQQFFPTMVKDRLKKAEMLLLSLNGAAKMKTHRKTKAILAADASSTLLTIIMPSVIHSSNYNIWKTSSVINKIKKHFITKIVQVYMRHLRYFFMSRMPCLLFCHSLQGKLHQFYYLISAELQVDHKQETPCCSSTLTPDLIYQTTFPVSSIWNTMMAKSSQWLTILNISIFLSRVHLTTGSFPSASIR